MTDNLDNVDLVLDARAILGEGAIWDHKRQVLYWIDIDPGLVHVYDPTTRKDRSISVGQTVGTVVPRKSGGLMLAVRTGFMSLDPETAKTSLIAKPHDHNPENRFNDGKCDPAGRFWAGTMETETRKGALFRLDIDLSVHRILDNVGCSNGITWTLDKKTMYYIDTNTAGIDAFDYDNTTGTISNRHTVVKVPETYGLPDGMSMDIDEKLWVAHWQGGCVCRWDPTTGRLLRKIQLPATLTTSCAFGGSDLDTLYVTSATTGLDATTLAKQPKAGGLFAVNPGVKGLPALFFEG
ncbi:MAG: SMP-30/gluconolactonase/LRE family protein [Candidatus Bathyarchaeia archaeon]